MTKPPGNDAWYRRSNAQRGFRIGAFEKERGGGPEMGTRCPPPCNKIKYVSRKEAKKAARQMQSDGRHEHRTMHVYPCHVSAFYHLTSLDAKEVEWLRTEQVKRTQRRIEREREEDRQVPD